MTPDDDGARRRRRKQKGAHRAARKRSALARTVAVSGAAVCIGVAYEAATPSADALSIVFNGNGQTVRINIVHGNIFAPQFGILGNTSNNTTGSDAAARRGGNIISELWSRFWDREIVIGGAVASSNTTEISIGSFNIFNPQMSIAGLNVSNNKTVANVAVGKGNNTTTKATSTGGMAGAGNTVQIAFFSGNIFNPQWTVFGANVSNNTAVTNIAANNGNNSSTEATSGWLRLLGGMTGNGNTTQVAGVTSNIFNQQTSLGGGNVSYNTAVTNAAVRNGNGSSVTSGGSGTTIFGTTGNGNTSQAAVGSSNISNDQINIGINTVGTVYTDRVITGEPWESGSSTVTVRTDNPAATNSAVAGNQQQSSGSNAVSQVTNLGSRQQSSAPGASGPEGSNSATLANQSQASGLGSLSTGPGNSAASNESSPGNPRSDDAGSGD